MTVLCEIENIGRVEIGLDKFHLFVMIILTIIIMIVIVSVLKINNWDFLNIYNYIWSVLIDSQ